MLISYNKSNYSIKRTWGNAIKIQNHAIKTQNHKDIFSLQNRKISYERISILQHPN